MNSHGSYVLAAYYFKWAGNDRDNNWPALKSKIFIIPPTVEMTRRWQEWKLNFENKFCRIAAAITFENHFWFYSSNIQIWNLCFAVFVKFLKWKPSFNLFISVHKNRSTVFRTFSNYLIATITGIGDHEKVWVEKK